MSAIAATPSELRWRPLEELATVIMGQSPPSSAYNTEGGGLPFFQGKAEFGALYPTAAKWCNAPKKIAEPGDILMSVRAPVGPTNLAAERCCIGRGLAAIRPREGVRSKWVLYAFRSMESVIDALGTGTTFKAISGETLRQLAVPVASLEHQDLAIAEIENQFSRLDEAVSNLRRVELNLRRYCQAKIAAACPKPGVTLSSGWRWQKLSDLGELARGKSKHRPRNDPKLYGGPFPFIQTAEVPDSKRNCRGPGANGRKTGRRSPGRQCGRKRSSCGSR